MILLRCSVRQIPATILDQEIESDKLTSGLSKKKRTHTNPRNPSRSSDRKRQADIRIIQKEENNASHPEDKIVILLRQTALTISTDRATLELRVSYFYPSKNHTPQRTKRKWKKIHKIVANRGYLFRVKRHHITRITGHFFVGNGINNNSIEKKSLR
ncbi:hypothetical protein CDAR_83201 [Caerostris darwini]|uniref:Uncharacterized protein n=1 Tax=Caerostris darwini TaxID=1538125 RepID=A0AAV4V1E6_9ARAC|nr:hypothetical protein CDAR_83201 [Caerostris darwini]